MRLGIYGAWSGATSSLPMLIGMAVIAFSKPISQR
jgi:hypothetical protein